MAAGITNAQKKKGGTVNGSFVNERLVPNGVLNGSRVGYFTFPEKGLYLIYFSFTAWLTDNAKGYSFTAPNVFLVSHTPDTTVNFSLLHRVTDTSQRFEIVGVGTASGSTASVTIGTVSLQVQCVKLFD